MNSSRVYMAPILWIISSLSLSVQAPASQLVRRQWPSSNIFSTPMLSACRGTHHLEVVLLECQGIIDQQHFPIIKSLCSDNLRKHCGVLLPLLVSSSMAFVKYTTCLSTVVHGTGPAELCSYIYIHSKCMSIIMHCCCSVSTSKS